MNGGICKNREEKKVYKYAFLSFGEIKAIL